MCNVLHSLSSTFSHNIWGYGMHVNDTWYIVDKLNGAFHSKNNLNPIPPRILPNIPNSSIVTIYKLVVL